MSTLCITRPRVAVGPAMPGFGSWEWVGEGLLEMLAPDYDAVSFSDAIPDCDVLVLVKHLLPLEILHDIAQRSAIVYCPIDYYGSTRHIDGDARALRCCSRILVHSHRLKKYFQSYARVVSIDHHARFLPDEPAPFRCEGYILWAGVRSNLPPLAEWANAHPLPGELRILTNLEDDADEADPEEFGFDPVQNRIRVARWSSVRHIKWTAGARCALDIKGDDFRQRHKPPTKAVDFIASGLLLAMNADSSSAEYLAGLGFEVATPEDSARWLSRGYYDETRQFGSLLRERLSFAAIGTRYRRIVADVLEERGMQFVGSMPAGAAQFEEH